MKNRIKYDEKIGREKSRRERSGIGFAKLALKK